MNDQKFLDFVEFKLFERMFGGCYCDDHLGNQIDPTSWGVSLRADQLSRLLDMAKESVK